MGPHVPAAEFGQQRSGYPAAAGRRGDNELTGGVVAGCETKELVALAGEEVTMPEPGVGKSQDELFGEGLDAVGAGGLSEQVPGGVGKLGAGGQVNGLNLHAPQTIAGRHIEVYVPRLPLIIVSVLAVLLGGGWLADSIAASRVERHLSAAVEEQAGLEVSPRVNVGGVPYLAALFTGQIPTVGVHALDVDVAGLGMVNAQTELTRVTVDRGQVLSGDIAGAPATSLTRTIRLDGVSLGRVLGMTDLDISNPYDISPAGGSAAEAQLIGTPVDQREPVTVIVELRLVGDQFHMSPRELVDAPADLSPAAAEAAREAFSLTLDTRSLPLAGRASRVNMSGGSIFFEAERHNVTVRLADLSPVDASSS